MLDTIRYLSDIGPHPGGSKEERNIADYLGQKLGQYSNEIFFDEFEYEDPNLVNKKSVNVIANFGKKKDKKIIICTNIDTIRNLDKVVDLWEKNIKNVYSVPYVQGANEPNSAIAFLIYFAEKLSKLNLNKNIELIGFGAQEQWDAKLKDEYKTILGRSTLNKINRLGYLIGSRHYVLSKGVDDVDCVIAIDAVGIGLPKIVIRDSFGKNTLDPLLIPNLQKIKIRGFRYKIGKKATEVIGCDHLPFRIAGVPSTWIIANKGELSEKNFLGYILNHSNIPNYGTSDDNYENLIKETSNDNLIKNYDLVSNALLDFIRKRGL